MESYVRIGGRGLKNITYPRKGEGGVKNYQNHPNVINKWPLTISDKASERESWYFWLRKNMRTNAMWYSVGLGALDQRFLSMWGWTVCWMGAGRCRKAWPRYPSTRDREGTMADVTFLLVKIKMVPFIAFQNSTNSTFTRTFQKSLSWAKSIQFLVLIPISFKIHSNIIPSTPRPS